MPRGPGRDQGIALPRLVRVLTALAQEAPGWVNRDGLVADLEFGAGTLESHREQLARDVRHLRHLGWGVETTGTGEDMRLRMLHQDPRLHTLLSEGQIRQLSRAVVQSRRDPGAWGLPARSSHSPPAPLLQGTLGFELEEILHALHHRCVLTITYRGRQRDVAVDEIRRTDSGRWLALGREQDGEQKTYRVDRIEDLHLGPPGSASPRQPVSQVSDPLTFADGEPVTAIVTTTAAHETRVTRDLGMATERGTAGDEVELTIPVVNHWLWRMRLYQLGSRLRLVGPEALRTEIRDELQAFVRGAS